MRILILWLGVVGIFAYTWKDWYRGLCGLILMMAVVEHPDMPKTMLNIPGLNPWNLLLLNIVVAWAWQRRNEGLRFDLPRHVGVLLLLYLGVMLIGFWRIIGDTSALEWYYLSSEGDDVGFKFFFNDYLINTIKWVIPGLLLYDGCRTEERFRFALISIIGVYVLLGIQVAKWMPPTIALDADALEHRGLRVLAKEVGYHRVNLSAMLAGASWAALSTRVLFPTGSRWMVVWLVMFIVYAQLMTGGRAGYGAWVAVGVAMSILKWRRYLLLLPVAGLAVFLIAPGIMGRALEGFTLESRDQSQRLDELSARGEFQRSDGNVDAYTVTAGRSIAWPVVIEKIKENPWTGYGRQAMLRAGIAQYIFDTYREAFPHPHNAYLEFTLDNGIIGLAPVLFFYALMLFYSIRLFLDKKSPTCVAAGGLSAALLLSLLVSAMGSQSFYPREGWVGMWCGMFLMLRVRTERLRLAGKTEAPEEPSASPVVPAFASLVPRSAFAMPGQVSLASATPVRAQAMPRISWVPRNGNGHKPAPRVTVPAPASPPVEKPAAAQARFRPAMLPSLVQGIQSWGVFGSKVSDTTVWERA